MKKSIIILLMISPIWLNAQVVKVLKKTLELQMPKKVTDTLPGTRGASVVWHPVQKKYYAAFAGNENFPLAVFSENGKLVSPENLICMVDVRGLWYNTNDKKIWGNGYGEIGWFSYTLDTKGIPIENEVIFPDMNQPDEQCVGVYNSKMKTVCFLSGARVYMYDSNAVEQADSSLLIFAGKSKTPTEDGGDEALSADYNSSMIYTGIPNAEIGLWNTTANQIELYSRKTGLMTQRLKLPVDIVAHPSFDFSYANGMYWLFSESKRKWVGYK